MREAVDVVVLSRDSGPLDPRVEQAIRSQSGVTLNVHRVIGRAKPGDRNRWETIARARNLGKQAGHAAWLMFVDDDVQLGTDCIRRLLSALTSNQAYGALAADYQQGCVRPRAAHHVTMGATLFRRAALNQIQFRWQQNACECQCCCDDLRRAGIGIDYAPGTHAKHLRSKASSDARTVHGDSQHVRKQVTGYVLAAFDRQHFKKFKDRFLASLRRSGNRGPVAVVAYGLYPSELRQLAYLRDVHVFDKPGNGVAVPIRRLVDFQEVVSQLSAKAAVGYWDTADVLFQGRLDPLWQLTQDAPTKLHVVSEPFQHPHNLAVAGWTLSVRDPRARRTAYQLMTTNPFVNSGFAAGTAGAMRSYLIEAHRLRHGVELSGTADWGDQTALNLFCYLKSGRHRLIDEGWNYCLCGRNPRQFYVRADGAIMNVKTRKPIPVVHGNNKTLESYWFSRE